MHPENEFLDQFGAGKTHYSCNEYRSPSDHLESLLLSRGVPSEIGIVLTLRRIEF